MPATSPQLVKYQYYSLCPGLYRHLVTAYGSNITEVRLVTKHVMMVSLFNCDCRRCLLSARAAFSDAPLWRRAPMIQCPPRDHYGHSWLSPFFGIFIAKRENCQHDARYKRDADDVRTQRLEGGLSRCFGQ
jgi:hypothetical protein